VTRKQSDRINTSGYLKTLFDMDLYADVKAAKKALIYQPRIAQYGASADAKSCTAELFVLFSTIRKVSIHDCEKSSIPISSFILLHAL
jgi:hypothetical protein